MGTLRRKSVDLTSSEKLSMTFSSSGCSSSGSHHALLYHGTLQHCHFPSVSNCDWLEVTMHSDQLRRSFGAQLLDGMYV